MKDKCRHPVSICMIFTFVAVLSVSSFACAVVTPTDPSFKARALAEPDPGVFAWTGSIAYYKGKVIYAGDDGNIYAYDAGTSASTVVCDTSALGTLFSSVTGFLVATDHYLYFHDNGNSGNIYRLHLADDWPASYESLDTQCKGFIYAFAQNPWTEGIWFASADIGAGNMYLYEVNAAFDNALERAAFAKPHGENAGNGPIIFKGPSTLLYGESVWGGNGYFHLVDSTTGLILEDDYMAFSGGLAGAAYGYNNVIFVTTGGGKGVFEVQGAEAFL